MNRMIFAIDATSAILSIIGSLGVLFISLGNKQYEIAIMALFSYYWATMYLIAIVSNYRAA